jgi:hypothetical protein
LRRDALDRDGFHRLLWRRANRQHKITFTNTALGKELAVSPFTISRLMAEFMRDRRAFKLRSPKRSGNTYIIIDPDEWAAQQQVS